MLIIMIVQVIVVDLYAIDEAESMDAKIRANSAVEKNSFQPGGETAN